MTYIEELRDVIRRLHGVEARHVESVPITEHFEGRTIWDGIVEVFEISGDSRTNKVYAWAHDTDDPAKPRHHVTVLHIPPVITPLLAVRAAIVQEFRNAQAAEAEEGGEGG
jgi:hypothetical protein